MKISRTTAFWGIPSIATLALGIGLSINSSNLDKGYKNFIQKTNLEYPIIHQVDSLDKSIEDLYQSEKELTLYSNLCGKIIIIHTPDPDKSLKFLDSSRKNILEGKFTENYEVKLIDEQIRIIQKEMSTIERNKYESFYEPQRTNIRGIEKRAEAELISLEDKIPRNIVDERNSLKNKKKDNDSLSILLLALGVVSSFVYGSWRFINRGDIDDEGI